MLVHVVQVASDGSADQGKGEEEHLRLARRIVFINGPTAKKRAWIFPSMAHKQLAVLWRLHLLYDFSGRHLYEAVRDE